MRPGGLRIFRLIVMKMIRSCEVAVFVLLGLCSAGYPQLITENGIINISGGPPPAQFGTVKSSAIVTLSNGNLTATGAAETWTGAIGMSAMYQSTGKYYAEFTAETISATDIIGIQNSSAGVTAVFPGGTLNGLGWEKDVSVLINNVAVANIATWTTSNTFSMAVDLGNQAIWFRVGSSGNWNNSGTANPATNMGGISIASLKSAPTFRSSQRMPPATASLPISARQLTRKACHLDSGIGNA
jgi:hypothetical protein